MEREIRNERKRNKSQSVENCFHLSNGFCSLRLTEVNWVADALLQKMMREFNMHSDLAAV